MFACINSDVDRDGKINYKEVMVVASHFNQENDLNLVLINELKLVPLNPIGLDNSLNLTGLELNGQVTLANIKSFEFNHIMIC